MLALEWEQVIVHSLEVVGAGARLGRTGGPSRRVQACARRERGQCERKKADARPVQSRMTMISDTRALTAAHANWPGNAHAV